MHPHSPITVVTSPGATRLLSARDMCPTPTRPIQYRIEERRRTFYVTSELPPSQWDAQTMDNIFTLAEISETEQADGSETPNVRRTKSLAERKVMFEESSKQVAKDAPETAPRTSTYRSRRRPGSRSEMTLLAPNLNTPPNTPQRASPYTPTRHRILFYHKHDPHYGFTNFSSHPVQYKGKKYPTSEHLFQSFKFQDHRPNLAEHIRTCSERPSVAFSEARRFQPEARPDWKHVNIQKMDETLWHKFTQHLDLKEELLMTGDAELVEDSDKDAFWGVGSDRRGRNELGKALERLRARLREA